MEATSSEAAAVEATGTAGRESARTREPSCMSAGEPSGMEAAAEAGTVIKCAAVTESTGLSESATVSERTGMSECTGVSESITVSESTGMSESTGSVMVERQIVRAVPVVIEEDAVTVPIRCPVVPAPAETAEQVDPDSEPEIDTRLIDEQPRNSYPVGIEGKGRAVDDPRIVIGNVDHIRIGRLDDDRLSLARDRFLRSVLEVARLLRSRAHLLNRIHH